MLLSTTAFDRPPLPSTMPAWLEARARRSDFGYTGWRRRLVHLWSGVEVAWAGRHREAVVVAHAGLEATVAGRLLRLLSRRTRLVIFDPLLPADERADRWTLSTWRLFDRILVIRRGDRVPLQRRAGIDPERIRFLPYIVRSLPVASRAGGYVYSAGYAHRDWPTVLTALETAGLPGILATGAVDPASCPPRVQVLPYLSPEDGQRLAADAAVVVAALDDTDLPAGPLVLMDAMAMGQAVVATEVNGTRDYVEHGVTGLLVPPGQPAALAAALVRLVGDADEARRLGTAARLVAEREWSPERFIERFADELRDLGVRLSPGPGRAPAG